MKASTSGMLVVLLVGTSKTDEEIARKHGLSLFSFAKLEEWNYEDHDYYHRLLARWGTDSLG